MTIRQSAGVPSHQGMQSVANESYEPQPLGFGTGRATHSRQPPPRETVRLGQSALTLLKSLRRLTCIKFGILNFELEPQALRIAAEEVRVVHVLEIVK